MANFLLGAAGFVLAMVALGLLRILRGPTEVDRMMAAQLVGTGGVAVLLLLAAATATSSIVDVALILALLSSPRPTWHTGRRGAAVVDAQAHPQLEL